MKKLIKTWLFIGVVVCIDGDDIGVSLVDPATKDTICKVIPKKGINFICSENDYVKVTINEYIDGSTDYIIRKHTIKVDKRKRAKIIEEIKARSDRSDIV